MSDDRPETPTDRRRAERAAAEAAETKYTTEQIALDKLHVDVFETDAGKQWLAHMEDVLLQRVTSPEMTDGALRGLEHTRNFLRTIKSRIARFHEKGGAKG